MIFRHDPDTAWDLKHPGPPEGFCTYCRSFDCAPTCPHQARAELEANEETE